MERVDTGLDDSTFGTVFEFIDNTWDRFTDMERAVLLHLMAGRSRKRIAKHFEVSRQIIGLHIQGIQGKIRRLNPELRTPSRRKLRVPLETEVR